MKEYEGKGKFYLGKVVDPSTGKKENEPLLLDSKDFTTHAVCVGMTGSGKTGLGITLLEEAALDGIPAIIIDPKGDLGNLLLTFPELSPQEFEPWVDASEAGLKGESLSDFAREISKKWKDGLASWQQTPERIQKLRETVEMVIYTPANTSGNPLSILHSFEAPPKEELNDPTVLRDKILTVTSGLLGLLGISGDPIKSKESILISSIFQHAWERGLDLDITSLIQQVQKPPFDKIGALDIDTFYPAKERMALSISLNNLLASPGFQAWMEGPPLSIDTLLYTATGKPKLSILSIAHLSDPERMFFVTLLLNEFLSWMRQQPGASNLRALLYMDEIFGFFPPTAAPPSKLPMITLLKQARAYGVGVILCTQNPVDLDYKGLANCGTWFIGKLQTERDKKRVLEGLNTSSNGEWDMASFDRMSALLGNRIFILRSIYKKEPLLFETRWTMSYLRGPLTLPQIGKLTVKIPYQTVTKSESAKESNIKSPLPPEIVEYYFSSPKESSHQYAPYLGIVAKVHFVEAKNRVDTWSEISSLVPMGDDGQPDWSRAIPTPGLRDILEKSPKEGMEYQELPPTLKVAKNYDRFAKEFATYLYQNETYSLKEEGTQKIREKYEAKIDLLKQKMERGEAKVEEKQNKAWIQKIQTFITFLTTLIGSLLGGKLTKGTINQAGTTLRRVGQISKNSQDVSQAEESVEALKQRMEDLRSQMEREISGEQSGVTIRPRKGDTTVEFIALVWGSL